MSTDLIAEARRQTEICNACRYCEGYCSVFPALTRNKVFADGDITHLANLCHNCRGCYYSCQYTEPHEFALNFPAALAEVRQESWERHAWPAPLARRFHRSGVAVALVLAGAFALLFGLLQTLRPETGEGFYAFLTHRAMVAMFLPAFLLPLVSVAISLRAYWREIGGQRLRWRDVVAAAMPAARLTNLDGGQGQGCNFEQEDRYSDRRRWLHQAVMYGFLLCFAATSAGTILHYVFDMPAPYGLLSLPKLLGVPGGVLLTIGCAGLAWLKTQADPALGAARVWGGEMAFVGLLGATGATGLALYAAMGTAAVPALLAVHLGAVLSFFLLLPYTKMIHGFYRFATLVAEEQAKEAARQALARI